MMLAPVSFVPNLGVVFAPGAQLFLSTGGLALPKQPFGQKAKPKGKTPATETHRAGDWVCILCHNLNYSFRKVCNRCQVQTKRENLLQSLSLLGNKRDDEPCPQAPPEHSRKNIRVDSPPGLDAEDADAEHFEQLRRTFDTPSASAKKQDSEALSTNPGSAQHEPWNRRLSPASGEEDDSAPTRFCDFLSSPARPFRLFHAEKPLFQGEPAIGGKPARQTGKLADFDAGPEEDASILRSVHSLLDEQ